MQSPSTVVVDGVEYERYPIYAPSGGGAGVEQRHLVRFLSQLPTARTKHEPVKPHEPGTPMQPPASLVPAAPAPLLYPFSSATRLCTPRHVDYRSKFINRKKLMKAAATQAQQAAAAATAAKTASAAAGKEVEEEGVEPTERKWRLEDPKQAKENSFIYLGSRDVPPRKEIHQQTANHFSMLVRQEGKFLLVPVETYSFRHVDGEGSMTLEEAEQKMKSRMKRFEKRVRNMTTLQQHHDEEEAAAGGASAAGGGGGGGGGGMTLERARPTGTTKSQSTEKTEKADDAFADAPSSRSKSGVLARKAKAKREEGADYTRQFDDDDIDGNDDRLDGQGGEASDRESDDEEALAAEQAAAEADAAALEKKKAVSLQRKAGMTLDEAEEEAEWAEAAEEAAEDMDDDDDTGAATKKEAATAVKRATKKESDTDDEEYDDSDLSLDDESDEEEQKESSAKVKSEAASRKRPSSPAAPTAAKKVKTETGAAAAATPAAPAGPITPAEVTEIEQLVIRELLAAPKDKPFTPRSLMLHFKKFPVQFNKRTAVTVQDVLKRLAAISPDKSRIMLRKEYQK